MEVYKVTIIFIIGFCSGMLFIITNGGKDNDD